MFAQLDDTFRNAWWNKVDVTPKYLLWACFSLLTLGVLIGCQLTDATPRHLWSWILMPQLVSWILVSFTSGGRFIELSRNSEKHNG